MIFSVEKVIEGLFSRLFLAKKVHFVCTRLAPFLRVFMCLFQALSQCMKITEKVSFNIASVASYVYILSGQKFIKN